MSAGGKGGFFSVLMFVGIVGALLVSGWQALTWLMTSVWKPISVLSALNWLHIPWAVSTGSWYGLHQLLANTSLALALLGVAVLSFLAFALFD
jgi:hypothetical protein